MVIILSLAVLVYPIHYGLWPCFIARILLWHGK